MLVQHYFAIITSLIAIVDSVPRRRIGSKKDFLFPDEVFIVKETPKCATNTTYCENSDGYPTEYLRRSLQNKDYYHLFGTPDSELIDRTFHNDGSDLCPNRRLTIYPQVAVNTKRQWRYIYNFENYIQGIQIEVCIARESCDLLGVLPTSLARRTKCKQKFMQRRLLSTDEEGRPVVDYFMLPSACSCTYVNDYSFLWKL